MADSAETKKEKAKKGTTGELLTMIGLGSLALVVVGAVIFGMTRKPKLNDDAEDAGAGKTDPGSGTASPLSTTESTYDPQGRFTLDDAKRAVPGDGHFVASIRTSKGEMTCALYDDRAPLTVANFVGLATGARAWKDPKTKMWVHRPAYDGTPFHRVIKGFMIQGGDPLGNGTGEPGYTFTDEIWPGAHHDRAGLLCMANRGPNTNGAQFFIHDAPAPHLDGGYTIFGDCTPLDVVHDIANVPVDGERPRTPVIIESVRIRRTG